MIRLMGRGGFSETKIVDTGPNSTKENHWSLPDYKVRHPLFIGQNLMIGLLYRQPLTPMMGLMDLLSILNFMIWMIS